MSNAMKSRQSGNMFLLDQSNSPKENIRLIIPPLTKDTCNIEKFFNELETENVWKHEIELLLGALKKKFAQNFMFSILTDANPSRCQSFFFTQGTAQCLPTNHFIAQQVGKYKKYPVGYHKYYSKIKEYIENNYEPGTKMYPSDIAYDLEIPYNIVYSILIWMEENGKIKGRRK